MIVEHQFGPYYDQDSHILILGSFPSVQSRKEQFYYAHKQNRFWKVLACLFDEKIPESIFEKKQLLQRNHIALWDVIESCEIVNSDVKRSIESYCDDDPDQNLKQLEEYISEL